MAICLLGVACSFTEVFFVCMFRQGHNNLVALLTHSSYARRFPSHISTSASMAIIDYLDVRRRVVLSSSANVGYGC